MIIGEGNRGGKNGGAYKGGGNGGLNSKHFATEKRLITCERTDLFSFVKYCAPLLCVSFLVACLESKPESDFSYEVHCSELPFIKTQWSS